MEHIAVETGGYLYLITSYIALGLSISIIEILMSFDNAAVLVQMAKEATGQEERALAWGYCLAAFFRVGMILGGVQLISFLAVQILGGSYLLLLAINHMGKANQELDFKKQNGFWMIVANLGLTDLVFAIDSGTGILGITTNVPVIMAGMAVGMVAMYLIGRTLLRFGSSESYKLFGHTIPRETRELFVVRLTNGAYVLIALIGMLLLARASFGVEMPKVAELIFIVSVIALSIWSQYHDKIGEQIAFLHRSLSPWSLFAARPLKVLIICGVAAFATTLSLDTVLQFFTHRDLHATLSNMHGIQHFTDLLTTRA